MEGWKKGALWCEEAPAAIPEAVTIKVWCWEVAVRVVKGGQRPFHFHERVLWADWLLECPAVALVDKQRIKQIFLLGSQCFHKLSPVSGWLSQRQTLGRVRVKVTYWEVFLENPCGRGVGRCVVTNSLSVPVTKKFPNVELPVLKLGQSQADPGSW